MLYQGRASHPPDPLPRALRANWGLEDWYPPPLLITSQLRHEQRTLRLELSNPKTFAGAGVGVETLVYSG